MKRIFLKLVVFLLLGALINVGVAWGCAWWSKPSMYFQEALHVDEPDSPLDGFHAGRNWGFGWERVSTSYIGGATGGTTAAKYEALLPDWGRSVLDGSHWSDKEGLRFIHEVRTVEGCGLPMLTLWGGVLDPAGGWHTPFPPPGDFAFAIPLESSTDLRTSEWRWLPLFPMLPGFAINTLFYAALLWLPFAAFVTRRLIRKRRGRCVRCGYDLTGTEHDLCPEYGEAG